MNIQVIASSSKGNCLVVDDGASKLMLDAGLPYSKLAKKVKISEMAGILISHEHGDHAQAVPELMRRGYPVYMSFGTGFALHERGLLPSREHTNVAGKQQVNIGSWVVLPFDLNHDVAEPLGFLFQSTQTGEKGVYIVDSSIVDYDFTGVHTWLIECNYADDLLEASDYHPQLKKRVRGNHFSLENLKVFLRTSDLSATEEIWLLHLSRANSNEERFKQEIQALTGVPTYSISDSKKPVVS